MHALRTRVAELADLPAILEAENDWPETQRASAAALRSRLIRFPDGFHLVFDEERLAGFSTSAPLNYAPPDLSRFVSWKHATNDGFLAPPEAQRDANALYIVSTLIRTDHRGGRVLEALVSSHRETARRHGFTYILTGATIPGYDAYCRRYGECAAADYALARERGRPRDAFLRILAGLGLELPDARHVIPDYYPSPESRDYGALVVRSLSETSE